MSIFLNSGVCAATRREIGGDSPSSRRGLAPTPEPELDPDLGPGSAAEPPARGHGERRQACVRDGGAGDDEQGEGDDQAQGPYRREEPRRHGRKKSNCS